MDLGEWILEHDVGWELRRRHEKGADGVLRAGLQLELFAHGPTLADDPGSPECRIVHERLVAVACLAVPPELQPVFSPFDRAFRLGPGPDAQRPEIELLVDLPLSNGGEERTLVRLLEAQLRRLGVRPRHGLTTGRQPAAAAGGPTGVGVEHADARGRERSIRTLATENDPPLSNAA